VDNGRRSGVVARAQLRTLGSVTFEDFIVPEAVVEMLEEARAAQRHAYRREALYTAYMADEAIGDETHPTRRLHPYVPDAVANDRLNPSGVLTALYRDETFIRFIAEIPEEPELYPLAYPILGLTVTYLKPGDEHGWHFDRNDFVVSLLLQQAEGGGVFEFAPLIRSEDDPNYEQVTTVMDGDTRALHLSR
jgi:hypothetical protein